MAGSALKEKREKRHRKFEGYEDEKLTKGDKPKNMLSSAKKMLGLLSENKGRVALVIVVSIISTVLSIVGPVYLGDIIDTITELISVKLKGQSLDFTAIKSILLTILAIYTASSVSSFLQHYFMAGLNRNLIYRMRSMLNKKLSSLPLKYFDTHTKGDILSRVTNDIDNIQNTFQNNLIQVITSVVSVVGVFAIMLYISPLMTLISVVSLPFGLAIALVILKASRKYFRENWKTMGDLNGHIEEMYTGHKIVKVFGHTRQACEEFTEINDELCEIGRKAQFLSGILMPIVNFTSNIGYVLICVFGGLFVSQGKMSLGDVTVFIVYSKLFMQPLVDISNIANNLQSSLASAERVFEVLEQESEPEDRNDALLPEGAKNVKIENVSFRYIEEKPLIESLNLTVEPGQLVALVGPTGAGKTTIVNLLMRFYDINSGSIKIGGTDIRDIPRNDLRKTFGMVLQDTWLFEGSIKDNIAYGRPDATDEEIKNAAKAARAHHFITTLSDGYDTVLEEGAGNISQGQRQLLTIARAILADPEILILDEATSSVDTRTEVLIQKAMKTLMQGRTNFVIAHRLSTIRDADVILVMNNGSIVECGTHNSLIEKNGFYRELYEAQFSGST
ncbi:MAG: ABC transporter ATP-binding protein/permease, partial [Clostridia bacterium]|nr:ABC transporter ATP-binding protein/permease [Clostridia bacterium]